MDFNLYKEEVKRKKRLRTRKYLVLGFFLLAFFLLGSKLLRSKNATTIVESPAPIPNPTAFEQVTVPDGKPLPPPAWHYKTGPVSMAKMKTNGCVADGILSGYAGHSDDMADMMKRSDCIYLHRALETWLSPPDFKKASKVMQQIDKPGLVYGMFLAEALKKNADYKNPETDEKFDFNDMCQPDSANVWGEHTCIPDISKESYRKYLSVITRQAMDLGIQSFMFGQVFLQDRGNLDESKLPKVLADMRAYAKQKNIEIVIGAQTNSITDEKYLKMFDYIEGGVGINSLGEIQNNKCFDGRSGCWALLWNDVFRSKANNVFLHLDWTGIFNDDMDIFARMDKDLRVKTLSSLYSYFTAQNMGFLMPFSATLHKENPGCYGPKKGFYSADKNFSCQDENAINAILPDVRT